MQVLATYCTYFPAESVISTLSGAQHSMLQHHRHDGNRDDCVDSLKSWCMYLYTFHQPSVHFSLGTRERMQQRTSQLCAPRPKEPAVSTSVCGMPTSRHVYSCERKSHQIWTLRLKASLCVTCQHHTRAIVVLLSPRHRAIVLEKQHKATADETTAPTARGSECSR